MTTETATAFIVTSCPDHGTVEAPDLESALAYIGYACTCYYWPVGFERTHALEHAEDGTDCWVCCDNMVIDPNGLEG